MIKFVPNILTLMRLLLTCIFLVMILYIPDTAGKRGDALFIDMIFILFLIAGLTDIVDGIVARSYNASSKFGRILDPFVDKVLVCGGFICLAAIGQPKIFNLSPILLGIIQWIIAGIITFRELVITVVRHIAEYQGINFAATFAGKIKMFVQSVAIGAILVKIAHFQNDNWANWLILVLLLLAAAVTVISAFPYIRRSPMNHNPELVSR